MRRALNILKTIAVAWATFTFVQPAYAAIYQINGEAFTYNSSYNSYAVPVPFSGTGSVCAVRFFYTVEARNSMATAYLNKRTPIVGELPLVVNMASVESKKGISAIIRQRETRSITQPFVDSATDFLFVSLFPNNYVKILGVHVQIEDVCPQP